MLRARPRQEQLGDVARFDPTGRALFPHQAARLQVPRDYHALNLGPIEWSGAAVIAHDVPTRHGRRSGRHGLDRHGLDRRGHHLAALRTPCRLPVDFFELMPTRRT